MTQDGTYLSRVPEHVRQYVAGYVAVRTEGSSSQHKLPTREEVVAAAKKWFPPAEVEQAIDDLLACGTLILDDCYLCTVIQDVQ